MKGWFEMNQLHAFVFDPSKALAENDSREVVAGVETETLSLELNVYGVTDTYREETGHQAYLEYYVCKCENGEWMSVDTLEDYVKNLPYQGVLTPTIDPTTTEQSLSDEMTNILNELMALTA